MPDPSLSEAIKEAYAVAEVEVIHIHTLEIRHPLYVDEFDNPAPIRVVLSDTAFNGGLELTAPVNPGATVTFVPFSFDLLMPTINEQGNPELTITIDNVTTEIEQSLSVACSSGQKAEATYRVYTNLDTSVPQNNPPMHLTVDYAKATDGEVTARASFGDFVNKAFPNQTYNRKRFPGLARSS